MHCSMYVDANLELPSGVELSQLFHSLWQMDFIGIPVPLLENTMQKKQLILQEMLLFNQLCITIMFCLYQEPPHPK